MNTLNPAQKEAVLYNVGPSLVIAGAGSGKTRVLTYKIAYLIQEIGLPPYAILALTFTNKAAREMKERISAMVGEKLAGQLAMGTFHSQFSHILRTEAAAVGLSTNFTVYDTTDSKNLVKTIIKEMGLDEKLYKPGVVLNRISSAKNKMINSMLIANEFIAALPANETPATTEGYEGFFHLLAMKGEVEHTELTYIIRDHDREKFEARKALFAEIAKRLNEAHGEELVAVEVKDQYYNMREKVEPLMHIIDIAFAAMTEAGVEPKVKAIRGGTDGAQLSFKGLPCPNIFAGGLNFHGRYEFVPIQSIEKAMNVVVKIAELTARRY